MFKYNIYAGQYGTKVNVRLCLQENIQAQIWKDESHVICCSKHWPIQYFLTYLIH